MHRTSHAQTRLSATASFRLIPRLILIWLAAVSSSAFAATLTVNSLGDDTIAGNGLVTLREAMLAAQNNTMTDLGQTGTASDTIDLKSLAGLIVLNSNLPSLNSNVEIDGPGVNTLTLDGVSSFTMLTLGTAANVTLADMTIQHCFRAGNGGAIQNQGILTIDSCLFTSNRCRFIVDTADCSGSAIANTSAASSAVLKTCTFSDNISELRTNNTIFFVGSAVGTLGTLDATGCIFQHNSTLLVGNPPSGGGGMGNSLGAINGGTISIDGCTIRDGFFTQSGSNLTSWGSVYVGLASTFNATSSTWTGNVGNPASGIYASCLGATTTTLSLKNCTGSGNGDAFSGSFLFFNSSVTDIDLTMDQCTIVDNFCSSTFNPSIGGNFGPPPRIRISNSVLANADKSRNMSELQNSLPYTSNGFNFIANKGTAVAALPDKTYANTSYTLVRQLVDPIGDNGGQTLTCSLPSGSPLIDRASPTVFAASDQRGVARPRNGDSFGTSIADIGAFERFNGDLNVIKLVDKAQTATSGTLVYTLRVSNDHFNEPASRVVVTDTLPPNLKFVSFSGSTFTSVVQANGVITAKRTTLNAAQFAQVQITCLVLPTVINNAASATQLGTELNPGNNSATASTILTTPPAPRVLSIAPDKADPTSLSQIVFRVKFDRDVTGLDVSDFAVGPATPGATVSQVTALVGGSEYAVSVANVSVGGLVTLHLNDNDTVISTAGEPLGGRGNDGSAEGYAHADFELPQSKPVFAGGALGPPASTVFSVDYVTTDTLSGVRSVQAFYRFGSSGAFSPVPGGPFATGHFTFDTALHGGNGLYQFYVQATDAAGNLESKPGAPEIGVTFGSTSQNGVKSWVLY